MMGNVVLFITKKISVDKTILVILETIFVFKKRSSFKEIKITGIAAKQIFSIRFDLIINMFEIIIKK